MTTATFISRDELVRRLRALEPQLRACGVTSLAMFGSRARGDARPDSDLDLLIEVEDDAKFSLFDLAGLDNFIGDELGIETYAVVDRDLKQAFSDEIRADRVEVFS